MQIKIFNIPIPGGDAVNEEMNRFLRSKKVLQTERHIVSTTSGNFWCFCIEYTEQRLPFSQKKKVDYREVLNGEAFKRFSKMREIRKELAKKEGVPAYAVFTDKELAGIAKLEKVTAARLKQIEDIGEKKVEKYGRYFIQKSEDEKGQ